MDLRVALNQRYSVSEWFGPASDGEWMQGFLGPPMSLEESRGLSGNARVYFRDSASISEFCDYDRHVESVKQLEKDLYSRAENVNAVILYCSSNTTVSVGMVDVIASFLDLDMSFMRRHFDHRDYDDERSRVGPSERARWIDRTLRSDPSKKAHHFTFGGDCVSLCLRDTLGRLSAMVYRHF